MQRLGDGSTSYAQPSAPVGSGAVESAPVGQLGFVNEVAAVGQRVDALDASIEQLKIAQRKYAAGTGDQSVEQIDAMTASIRSEYRRFTNEVMRFKSELRGQSDAAQTTNKSQLERLDRKLQRKINQFRELEQSFKRDVDDQAVRQLYIVNPNPTEEEISEVRENAGHTRIYEQALLTGNRAQAQAALGNTKQRSKVLEEVLRTMTELQQMLIDLNTMVEQQEPMIQNIEQSAAETNDHMVAGNTQMTQAVRTARATRKKKWICLGIVGKLRLFAQFVLSGLQTNVVEQWPSLLSSSSSCSPT